MVPAILNISFSLLTIMVSLWSCATLEEASIEILNPEIECIEIQSSVPLAVDTCQIMTLNIQQPHSQGGDCWGDYFFQFSSDNSIVRIYNLAEKKLIQRYTLNDKDRGFVKNCHCNSVCFGSSYYEEGDEFPLLYVSTGYGSNGYSGALVYRIVKKNSVFSLSLVQTIRLPELETAWTEFVPAGNDCFVNHGNRVYRMPLPAVQNGDVILDGRIKAIEVIDFPSRPQEISDYKDQARLYHNEMIILLSSVQQAGETSVLVFMNLKTKAYDYIIGVRNMGLTYEPESVFFWRNKLCVAFLDQIVSFEFTPNILN